MGEVWNSVSVYGPASEIERFKRLCVQPDDMKLTAGQSGWDGCGCLLSVPSGVNVSGEPSRKFKEVVNFQQFKAKSLVEYEFSFDTHHEFPVDLFEGMARYFSRLTFDCECIEALDEFMGFGWFNVPPGGKGFNQSYKVPKNFWTSGSGYKRTPAQQAKHEACTRWLEAMMLAEKDIVWKGRVGQRRS